MAESRSVSETLEQANLELLKAHSLMTTLELSSIPVKVTNENGSVIWDDATLQDLFSIVRELVDKGRLTLQEAQIALRNGGAS